METVILWKACSLLFYWTFPQKEEASLCAITASSGLGHKEMLWGKEATKVKWVPASPEDLSAFRKHDSLSALDLHGTKHMGYRQLSCQFTESWREGKLSCPWILANLKQHVSMSP